MFFGLVVVATATGARALGENQKPMTHRSSPLLSKYLRAFAELDLTFAYKYIVISQTFLHSLLLASWNPISNVNSWLGMANETRSWLCLIVTYINSVDV